MPVIGLEAASDPFDLLGRSSDERSGLLLPGGGGGLALATRVGIPCRLFTPYSTTTRAAEQGAEGVALVGPLSLHGHY